MRLEFNAIDPFCALHGKRMSEHETGFCLYCCICFKPLTPETCVVDVSGKKWDACKGQCAVEAGIQQPDDVCPTHGTPLQRGRCGRCLIGEPKLNGR